MKRIVGAGMTVAAMMAITGCTVSISGSNKLAEQLTGSWQCEVYRDGEGPNAQWDIDFGESRTITIVDTADPDWGDTELESEATYTVAGDHVTFTAPAYHVGPQRVEWDGVVPDGDTVSELTWKMGDEEATVTAEKTSDGYRITLGEPVNEEWRCEAD